MRILGIQNALKAVREIEKTGVLKNEIAQVSSINIINHTPQDSIVVDKSTY